MDRIIATKLQTILISAGVTFVVASSVVYANKSMSTDLAIFVNGNKVGTGFEVQGTTYIPLRSVSEGLGAAVEYDATEHAVRISTGTGAAAPATTETTESTSAPKPILSPKPTYVPGTALSATQGKWVDVRDSGSMIRFKDAAVAGYQFSADVRIAPGFFKATTKPITSDFTVTLYDRNGSVVGREKATIYNVSSSGGTYVLDGPSAYNGTVQSVIITYTASWTRSK